MYRKSSSCIGMKVYKEKFSSKWQWMSSFCEHKNETKRKRKEDLEGQHVTVRKHKSFVESRRIFWKQGTGAKSLFS